VRRGAGQHVVLVRDLRRERGVLPRVVEFPELEERVGHAEVGG
jgi:hypothetical protein